MGHKNKAPKACIWRHSTAVGGPDDGMRQRGTPTTKLFSGGYHKNPFNGNVLVYKPPKRFKDDNAQAKDLRMSKAERKAREKLARKEAKAKANAKGLASQTSRPGSTYVMKGK